MKSKMKKRQLGKSDIYLSAIGFGGAPIGNLFEQLDEPTCYEVLENPEEYYNDNILGKFFTNDFDF